MCGVLGICNSSLRCPASENGNNAAANVQTISGKTKGLAKTFTVTLTGPTGDLQERLQRGVDAIQHRGPDGSAVWVSDGADFGLAHCRLAINDLSARGSQPLHDKEGKIHAVVNGELYDYGRLRAILETEHGYNFTSDSDNGKLALASEAKAFVAMGWKPEWDVDAICDCHWLVDDRTLFKNVKKLMPGHWMEMSRDGTVGIHQYWDAEYPDKNITETRTVDEMVLEVRKRLVDAVEQRLRADVPVGIYLSGGIDSSVIAGIAVDLARQKHIQVGSSTNTQISCFSMQFGHESGYDETDIADRTAAWLGIKCHKLNIDEDCLADNFEDAVLHSEHHHFDLNAVSKFALSKFARQHGVKVVLTGEGSDEHFCGYPSFATEYLREQDATVAELASPSLEELRCKLFLTVEAKTSAIWRSQAQPLGVTGGNGGCSDSAHGSSMPAGILRWQPPKPVYEAWIRDQYDEDWNSCNTLTRSHSSQVREKMRAVWHPSHSAMYMWNKSILPNVLLTCLGDRTEMANSLEGRTPFLDHHLAEYVNSLPPSVKLRLESPENGASASAFDCLTEKWILREAGRPYLTDELYNRRKVTFWAPNRWPRGGRLHSMFGDLLTKEALSQLGFVDYDAVAQALDMAFGDAADDASFRIICYVASWVVLSRRVGVKPAVPLSTGELMDQCLGSKQI
ncbi:hypothetical protein G3M48_002706 [Beauveria asiatica]|uniref:Glutamine amidotransferase type-2 domain-containing protein n=1 Tax=Beauveria asiatica TaxID=1069075 RepID=A0AAW0RXQ2_9HYPO